MIASVVSTSYFSRSDKYFTDVFSPTIAFSSVVSLIDLWKNNWINSHLIIWQKACYLRSFSSGHRIIHGINFFIWPCLAWFRRCSIRLAGYLNDHKSCKISMGAMYFNISCKFSSKLSKGESSTNNRPDKYLDTMHGSSWKVKLISF